MRNKQTVNAKYNNDDLELPPLDEGSGDEGNIKGAEKRPRYSIQFKIPEFKFGLSIQNSDLL